MAGLPCQALGSCRTCFINPVSDTAAQEEVPSHIALYSAPSLLYDTGVFSTKLKQVNRKPPGDRLSHSPLLVAVSSAFLSSPYAVSELGGTLTFLFYDQHQWKCRSLSLLPHGEEGQWEKSPVWELQAPHSLGPASPPAVVGEVVLCSMWCQRGPWGSCPHWRTSWECGRCCLLAPPSSF